MVLDIEFSVRRCLRKQSRALLRARTLLLPQLLVADSQERPFAVCGISYENMCDGVEANDLFCTNQSTEESRHIQSTP